MKEQVHTSSHIIHSPLSIYYCGHEICASKHSFGPAIRPHYLIHYIIRGTGTYYENHKDHHLMAGDCFMILPWQTTFYIADESDPWEYAWFAFDGQEVPSILSHCGMDPEHLIMHSGQADISSLLLNLNSCFNTQQGNEYTYRSYIYQFFSFFAHPKESDLLKPSSYIEKALYFIQHNYSYDITIFDLAEYLHIDRTYLYKLFEQYQNMSPQQYLISYRLGIACKLLRETDMTIVAVACSCGFKDAPSFNKHFSKHFKITPTTYRKSGGSIANILYVDELQKDP